MSTPFLGEIKIVAFAFAPKGWALCNGQIIPILQNQALFALLGTQFGGNGQTTFALPNLQSRVMLGAQGQGSGLSAYAIGEQDGQETHTLSISEMGPHSHLLNASNLPATATDPTRQYFAKPQTTPRVQNLYGASGGLAASNAIQQSGGSQPHNNLQPYLVVNCIIALQGIFPSQN